MTEDAVFELLILESRVDEYGTVHYYNSNGRLHRVYGPAVENAAGEKFWFHNGQRHRLDGPAVEHPDGRREWYQNGLLHRLDGPAIERPDGYRAWYINDWNLTEAEWQQAVASMEAV
jgi:hypothetical protein